MGKRWSPSGKRSIMINWYGYEITRTSASLVQGDAIKKPSVAVGTPTVQAQNRVTTSSLFEPLSG